MSDTELMYGGTVRDLQVLVGKIAHRGETRFGEIADAARKRDYNYTADEVREQSLAHAGAHFGWALVAVISMLNLNHPKLAEDVANLVQDIGENGGLGWQEWGADIYREVAGEPSDAA